MNVENNTEGNWKMRTAVQMFADQSKVETIGKFSGSIDVLTHQRYAQ